MTTARIVLTEHSDAPSGQSKSVAVDFGQQITSEENLRRVLAPKSPQPNRPMDVDSLIARARRGLSVAVAESIEHGTIYLTLTSRDPDPRWGVGLVNALTQQYVADHEARRDATDARSCLESSRAAKQAATESARAQAVLDTFLRSHFNTRRFADLLEAEAMAARTLGQLPEIARQGSAPPLVVPPGLASASVTQLESKATEYERLQASVATAEQTHQAALHAEREAISSATLHPVLRIQPARMTHASASGTAWPLVFLALASAMAVTVGTATVVTGLSIDPVTDSLVKASTLLGISVLGFKQAGSDMRMGAAHATAPSRGDKGLIAFGSLLIALCGLMLLTALSTC